MFLFYVLSGVVTAGQIVYLFLPKCSNGREIIAGSLQPLVCWHIAVLALKARGEQDNLFLMYIPSIILGIIGVLITLAILGPLGGAGGTNLRTRVLIVIFSLIVVFCGMMVLSPGEG